MNKSIVSIAKFKAGFVLIAVSYIVVVTVVSELNLIPAGFNWHPITSAAAGNAGEGTDSGGW